MPQESLLALGAIVTVVIGAVAMLEGSTATERDRGDRLTDSARLLLEETGAIAAMRTMRSLFGRRSVRQARRPMIGAPLPLDDDELAEPYAPSLDSYAAAAPRPMSAIAAMSDVDPDEETEVWLTPPPDVPMGRPLQPNRIVVSKAREPRRPLVGGLRNAPLEATGMREERLRRLDADRAAMPRRRMRRQRGPRVVQALTAVLFVALLIVTAAVFIRPQSSAGGVLAATSTPAATPAREIATPIASEALAEPTPAATPNATSQPRAKASPKATSRATLKPTP
jgi:hypothetical protein